MNVSIMEYANGDEPYTEDSLSLLQRHVYIGTLLVF